MEYLELEDVIEINRKMISRFGGIFFKGDNNLANSGSLEYILEAVQSFSFGQELYPTLVQKAAALAWNIITRHVFHDGNKRTGMESCRLMLNLNGYTMRIDQEVVCTALHICDGTISFEEFVQWVEARTTRTATRSFDKPDSSP